MGVYDPASGDLVSRLNDGTDETFTAGSAFDAAGNFYVTDDYNGDISEYNADGALQPTFATGLSNPLSLVFDNRGNLYVGQQTTPYIAEFSPSGESLTDIGPLATENAGDDWIDLAPDQCTFYYTSEGTDILRYDKCTDAQLSNFNVDPFPDEGSAYELRILPDGDVLVADTYQDYLLDSEGNVIQTYSCSSLPGCEGELFSIAIDPSGTSFWTGDAISGNVWQIGLSSGDVIKRIDTTSGSLYGLSVDGEPEASGSIPEGGVLTAAEGYDGGAPTECSCLSTNGKSGDPVNPMDGDFYESDTDLSTPGPGVALGFTRDYDAIAAQSGVSSPLGPGWTDNLDMSVSLDPTTSIATVTESNGAQVQFMPYDRVHSVVLIERKLLSSHAARHRDAEPERRRHLDLYR